MKMNLVVIVIFVGFSSAVLADPCSDATPQMKQLSLQLAHSAIANAENILKKLPLYTVNCPAVLLAKARITAAKSDPSGAEALLKSYIDSSPEDSKGYAYLARVLIDEGEFPRADAASATAIEKGANDPAALAVRGQLVAMKGDKQGGVQLLNEAANLDPEDAEAQFQLGSIYDRAKLPADAVMHFKRAVALDPSDARAWDYLALNLEPLGDLEGASAAYKKGLLVNHEGPHYDAFLDYNYGRFLMKQGDLSASKVHIDRAIALVPTIRATWYERARLDLRLRNYQLARTDAEMAASLPDPDGNIIDLQLYAILEQIYRRLGETGLANKYADLGRQTPPPVRGEHH